MPVIEEPFWSSHTVRAESVLFVENDHGLPSGELLFVPTKIVAATNSAGTISYEQGPDFVLTPGTRRLTIPPGSRIPVTSRAKLTPPIGSQPYDLRRRDGSGEILFGSTLHEYADLQTVFTYEHVPGTWPVPPPRFARKELPSTLARLQQGKALRIALFGDSISEGCQASKFNGVPPFQPAYGELLVQALERAYRTPISLANVSRGGMTAEWGAENIELVTAGRPDLVILAWGMNDNGTYSVESFLAFIERQMHAVREVNPEVEFILVSSMLPNPEWLMVNPERLFAYRDAFAEKVCEGVALADLTAVWGEFEKRKNYLDFTSNGVNHPNDFGHRVYAEVLAALLVPAAP